MTARGRGRRSRPACRASSTTCTGCSEWATSLTTSRTFVPSATDPQNWSPFDVAHDVLRPARRRSRTSRTKFSTYSSAGSTTTASRRADLHEPAVAHDRDPVAETQRLGQVVGDEHHRLVDLAAQADDLVLHVAADQRIERRERLVEQQDVGIGGQGPGEADALLLPATELMRAVACPSRTSPTSSSVSLALRRRAALSTPRTSRPNATLSVSVRCGSRPKCWNTIDTLLRRTSSSVSLSALVTSTSPMRTVPTVGSISRVRQRISVDLPLPDNPMTTKTSPGTTSMSMSRIATTLPVCASSCLRGRSASSEPTIRSGFGPYTFHRPRTEIDELVCPHVADASHTVLDGSPYRKGHGHVTEQPTSARAVIIGGGIVGCSTAYHLAKLGWTDTVLIERHKLTSGSTFHAAGLVGQLRSSANITQLLGYSVDLYKRLEDETGQATGWKMNGGLRLACNEERWNEVKRQATTAKSFGLEMHLLSPKEAQELWPLMTVDDVIGAAFLPTDGQANPTDITMALARGARMAGATICEDTEVLSIEVVDGVIAAVVTSQGRIECSVVVCCAGQWTRSLGGDGRRQRATGVGATPIRHHRRRSIRRCRAICRHCAIPTGSPTTKRRSAAW